MSKSSGSFDDIKKDFKNIFKHGKKSIKSLFRGHRHSSDDDCCSNHCGGYGGRRPNFFGGLPIYKPGRSPWFYILLCPRMCVVWIILIVLLLCGVSFYGVFVIVLLGIIFILI
ncbi:hypothetical protein [uncultured Clostridium sp.]|uniref:hypothetical protein n=1 Tax=uncultured Clostridium sp. TaxID=59620 RepID=UPI0025DA8D9B|nr:hypothetical protein [uncultured Clostridium sp.]